MNIFEHWKDILSHSFDMKSASAFIVSAVFYRLGQIFGPHTNEDLQSIALLISIAAGLLGVFYTGAKFWILISDRRKGIKEKEEEE